MTKDFVRDIKLFFKGDVDDGEHARVAASRDASFIMVKPELVVFPKDTEDVRALVRFVARRRSAGEEISLTARGAGTDMAGGPLTTSMVVDFTRYFDHIKEMGTDRVVVEPGVYYRDFEIETLKHGLLLPSFPASRDLCTVGGMVANNAGGEKSLTYGKTDRYVAAVKMVCADGNEYAFQSLTVSELEKKCALKTFEGDLYRGVRMLCQKNEAAIAAARPQVSKNSAGYALWDVVDSERDTFDLAKLIAGSQGTLGLITEITFRLVRPEPASRLLVIFLKDLTLLPTVIERVLKHHPESFESFDDHTFSLALRLFPQIAARLRGSVVRLVFDFLPEFWMMVTGGVPKLVLIADFRAARAAASESAARAALADLADLHLRAKITRTDRESQKYWVMRRESFNLLRHHVSGLRTVPFIDDLVVRPADLAAFLPQLDAILKQYDIIYTIAGHAGDGNFHIIPLMDLAQPGAGRIIEELATKVYDVVLQFHGSITGEHNDGLVRSPFLPRMFGPEVYQLFVETKKIFDPQGIFNPGKKTGASFSYALSHLDTQSKS